MKIISKWMGVVLLASSALFTTNVMAQDLKKPTLEDLIPKRRDLSLCKKPVRTAMVGRHVHQARNRLFVCSEP